MRRELAQFLASAGKPLRAADWNAWLKTLEDLMPEPSEDEGGAVPDNDHPFRVEVSRWESDLAKPDDRAWRADVSFACANDLPAAILYKRAGDFRGWIIPGKDWQAPGLPVRTSALDYLDRSLVEMGGDDPPFLIVTTPRAGAAKEDPDDDFQTWKGSRPTFFQQEEYAEKELWFASVTLSANPLHAFPASIFGPARTEIAAKLPEQFRLRAGRPPTSTFGGVAGGTIEIARLWLVRDPKAKDVLAADEILVQQKVYTHLQALIVTPGLSVSDGSILGDLAQELINEALAAAAGQEFWSG